jgi:hypothetical protein
MSGLRRGWQVVLVVAALGCTTSGQNGNDSGPDMTGGDQDAAGVFPTCAGDPCDGVCAVDFDTNEAYCAQRCGAGSTCAEAGTQCTALGGETVCLRPFVIPRFDGGTSSSSSSSSGGSSSGGNSSSMMLVDAGMGDAGSEVRDSGEPTPDAGYTPIVWLTNRCHLARVTIDGEKVCTASLTSVDNATVTNIRLAQGSASALRVLGTRVPATVTPGDVFAVAVVATPVAPGSLLGTLIVETSDGAQARLPVTGDAVLPAVPSVPQVVVRADGRALAAGAAARPNALLELDGAGSTTELGEPATVFLWRLANMPMGAPATLQAATQSRTLVVPINGSTLAPGSYVAGLRVGGSTGDLGPEMLVPFQVASLDDLVVELTWDQKDTDLDLVVFKGANLQPVFAPGPDNCGVGNCTVALPGPRWDGASAPRQGGNPLHQGNVQSGFGPERVTINAPVAGQYVVGVKYTNDFNLGVSSALVRITWRGRLIGQARRGLTRGQEWIAVRVTLPEGRAELAPGPAPTFCSPRCTAAQQCVNGTCMAVSGVTACNLDAECPVFNACVGGRCVDIQEAPRCLTGCASGTRCLGDAFCVTDSACTQTPGSSACLGGACNAVAGRCEAGDPPACIQNACEGLLMCIEGSCRECVADSECGPNTVCDGITGRCVGTGCLRDAECGSGRLCDLRHGGCVLPECSVDLECQAVDTRRLCDGQARRCYLPPAVCTGDTAEPNNEVTTATPVPVGMSGGTLCRADVDYLRIGTSPGQLLRVTVTFTPGGGLQATGITAELRSLDGRLLSGGVVGEGQSSLELVSLTAGGSDQILVLGGFGAATDSWTYALNVVGETLPACLTEPGEPNNAFTQADNSPLSSGTINRALCTPDDVDYHFLRVEPGQLARFKVGFNPADGNVSVSLLGVGGVVLETRPATTSPVLLERASTQAETLVLLVEPSGAPRTTAPRPYTLESSVTYIPNCNEDLFETNAGVPNNTQGAATVVSTGAFAGVACTVADEDWYRFTLPAGAPGPLTVQLSWQGAEDFLDLAIRTAAGQVAASTNPVNPRTINLSNLAANVPHFIQVRPKQPAGLTFRPLGYTLSIVAPTACSDDAREAAPGDDTVGSATGLRDAPAGAFSLPLVGKLCPGDVDHQSVVALQGEEIVLTLANLVGSTVDLLGPDGTTVLGSAQSGMAALRYTVPIAAGTYFFRVSGGAGTAGTYALNVAVNPPVADPCATPAGMLGEPNETPAAAFSTTLSSGVTAAVCPAADADHFALPVVDQAAQTVTLTYDATNADLDVTVLDALGAVVTSDVAVETGAGAVVTFMVTPTVTATWVVAVTAKAGATAPVGYTLTVAP